MSGPIGRAYPVVRSYVRAPTSRAVTALLGITLLFYVRVWLPDLVLIKRDAVRFFLPLKRYLVEQLASGVLPQWFPYEGMGRPFIGVPNTGVFDPLNVLYVLLPAPDAYRAATLLCCLLAAAGAYAVSRRLQVSRAGAVLAGIALTCSGYVASITENNIYLYSVCLLPIFCLALEQALAGARAWLLAPVTVWASVFLHGDMQTGYYYGFVALGWGLMRSVGDRGKTWWRLAVIGGLTALVAGVQLVPAAAIYLQSDRLLPSFHDHALHWSLHPLRLLLLIAAPVGDEPSQAVVAYHFFGGHPPGSGLPGFWAESLYLGVPVMGLALAGAWFRQDLRGAALLGVLALWLALGRYGGLYEVCERLIPLWGAFRYPERLMGIVTCTVALFAGAGLDEMRKGRPMIGLWAAAAIVCAAISAGLHSDAAGRWVAEAFGAPLALARSAADSSAQALLFSALAAAGVGLMAIGFRRNVCRPEWLLAAVVVIVAGDLARVNQAAYHTGPVEAVTFEPSFAEAMTRHAALSGSTEFRFLSIKEGRFHYPEALQRVLDSAGISSVLLRQMLDVEHNAEFHLQSIKTYLPGHSQAMEAMASLARQHLGLRAYARYNVAYFIGQRERFRDPLVAHGIVAELPDYGLALIRNPHRVMPRAYVTRKPERADGPVDLAALVVRPDFLSGAVDVIEAPGVVFPSSTGAGHASVVQYLPEQVQVRVEAFAPAVVVLQDAYDAGWRARLENGEEIPIWRANALARAVTVPAGSHTVTFWYQTPGLMVGLGLSMIGGVLGMALLVRWEEEAWRNRRFWPRGIEHRGLPFTRNRQKMSRQDAN